MPDRFVLAFDCGSTNLKGALFGGDLSVLGQASRAVAYDYHGPDRYEFDGEGVWRSAVGIILDVCSQAGLRVDRISDLSIGSQAQSFLFADGDGRAMTPVVSWLDRTAEADSAVARDAFGEVFHHHCSFADPIPQLQICKVRKMLRELPETVRGMLLSLPGWLGWRLGAANTTDANLAAMGGLYSLAERRWWPAALEYAGLRGDQMPDVVPLGESVPLVRSCAELALSASTRVVFAGNDQTCGAYGNGVAEGTLLATLGTALVAYRCTGRKPGPYGDTTFWGPYLGGRYYELATRDEGCLALDWVRSEVCTDMPLHQFDALVAEYRKSATVESPLFWPDRVGTAAGLPKTSDLGAAGYATLEGIGFALRELLEDGLGSIRGRNTVKIAGGGGKSLVWRQLIADILACPVVEAQGSSLIGAAAMALGQELTETDAFEQCEPDPGRGLLLEKRFERWREHDG